MKHKEVIIAMANDEAIEYLHPNNETWYTADISVVDPITYHKYEWRRKPKPIRVGNRDLPEPLRVAPEVESVYYTDDGSKLHWIGLDFDRELLRNGGCHATREAAQAWGDAMAEIRGAK